MENKIMHKVSFKNYKEHNPEKMIIDLFKKLYNIEASVSDNIGYQDKVITFNSKMIAHPNFKKILDGYYDEYGSYIKYKRKQYYIYGFSYLYDLVDYCANLK